MKCINPLEVWPDGKKHIVACGKCLACVSTKRIDWIFRLGQEHKASKGALFITLTYHPKFCPDQLEKRHLQLFMKRLRKRLPKRLRYFAVGEYGTNNGRPHYHVILFNVDNADQEYIRKSWAAKDGEPYGLIHIGTVTAASIAYCTKYVIQAIDFSSKEGKQKPFTLMSRGYGIGASYLTDRMVNWHRENDFNHVNINGIESRLPRYYKDKIWYTDKDKKRISDMAKWKAIKSMRAELRWFVKKYGVQNAKSKLEDFRNAQLANIRSKVAYTQKL